MLQTYQKYKRDLTTVLCLAQLSATANHKHGKSNQSLLNDMLLLLVALAVLHQQMSVDLFYLLEQARGCMARGRITSKLSGVRFLPTGEKVLHRRM